MTGGEELGLGAGLVDWARDARVRTEVCAAQAAAAAESAAAIGAQVDRMIGRAAERNPEYAERLRAIIAVAASRRAAITEWKRSRAAGRPGGQLLPMARQETGTGAVTGLEGHLRDLASVQDGDTTAGELHDKLIQGIFTAGLMLQGAADLTTEPEVRWRIEAATDDLDELIRAIRGALFDAADRPPSRQPSDGPEGVASPAGY